MSEKQYPYRIPGPTLRETIAALAAAIDARTLFDEFTKTGHCDPDTLIAFCKAIDDLEYEVAGETVCAQDRWEELSSLEDLNRELPKNYFVEFTSDEDEGTIHKYEETTEEAPS